MRLRHLALLLCFSLPLAACASETPTEHAAAVRAQQDMDAAPVHGNLPHYSLAPEKLVKAQRISQMRVTLHFVEIVWSVLQFVMLLWLGVVAKLRDKALATSADLRARGKKLRAFLRECVVFIGRLTLVLAVLNLPVSLYRHWVSLQYGLSVQGWAGWFADWGKAQLLNLGGSIFLAGLLMFLIRKFPQRWWLAFWLVLAPLIVIMLYGLPLVVDPLFNKFEPLQATNPALVQRLEEVVAKGHMDIPPERMFLMKASAKVTTMNAYVTGFGGSKRVVVWDTSLTKGSTDEVLFIFGHESGHYALGHVLRGVGMSFLGLFVLFYMAYRILEWSLRRFGVAWRIPSQSDWAAIAVLMFVMVLFETALEPLTNAISRVQEHAADVYGQEAIHGIVADPQAAAERSFQVLGETSLDEPNTPRFVEFWTDTHPAIGRRAAFAAYYDPWAPGAEPKYFKK